ncbi:MAG: hypothetical protein ACREIK_07650, partial [Nitrospiraceae bacterium]
PEGIEGEVPVAIADAPKEAVPPGGAHEEKEKAAKRTRTKGRAVREETGGSKGARAMRRVKPTPQHKTDAGKPSGKPPTRAKRRKS